MSVMIIHTFLLRLLQMFFSPTCTANSILPFQKLVLRRDLSTYWKKLCLYVYVQQQERFFFHLH